jgi:hypothetical protein
MAQTTFTAILKTLLLGGAITVASAAVLALAVVLGSGIALALA